MTTDEQRRALAGIAEIGAAMLGQLREDFRPAIEALGKTLPPAEPASDIAAFLGARYDGQEAAIIRYRDGHPGEPCTNSIAGDPNGEHYDEWDSCARHLAVAGATPYRDVEFGLADIAAKRRILDEVGRLLEPDNWDWTAAREMAAAAHAILRALAAPFASHPDFDPAWAVQ